MGSGSSVSRQYQSVILRILVGTQVKDKCGFSDFSEDGILKILSKDKKKASKIWLIGIKDRSRVNFQSVTDFSQNSDTKDCVNSETLSPKSKSHYYHSALRKV